MTYRELTMIDVREVLRRWAAGHSQRKIARETGTDRGTATRYIRFHTPRLQLLHYVLCASLRLRAVRRDPLQCFVPFHTLPNIRFLMTNLVLPLVTTHLCGTATDELSHNSPLSLLPVAELQSTPFVGILRKPYRRHAGYTFL